MDTLNLVSKTTNQIFPLQSPEATEASSVVLTHHPEQVFFPSRSHSGSRLVESTFVRREGGREEPAGTSRQSLEGTDRTSACLLRHALPHPPGLKLLHFLDKLCRCHTLIRHLMQSLNRDQMKQQPSGCRWHHRKSADFPSGTDA